MAPPSQKSDPKRPISREDCERYLTDSTFRLLPGDIEQKYPYWAGAVGLEVEMLVLRPTSGAIEHTPEPVPLAGERGLASILRSMAKERRWKVEETAVAGSESLPLRILIEAGDALTFEPGGQLEISTLPYPCVSEAFAHLSSIQQLLDEGLAAHGLQIVQVGINPWHTVDRIGLQMTKPRYRAMDEYFTTIGPYGRRMMRQTMTVQVNLDFGASEETLSKRYLASMLLAPIMGATFAYSGWVDGAKAEVVGTREKVWRHIDGSRTGIPDMKAIAQDWSRASCVESYLDFVLKSNVPFVEALGYEVPSKPLAFGEWLGAGYKGTKPTLGDFKTHLSLMFPEVRPRGFIELRSIDCQSRVWQEAAAAYCIGLLYDAKALDGVLDLLMPHIDKIPELLNNAVGGPSADKLLARLARGAMTQAREGFGRMEDCFRTERAARALDAFAQRFTEQDRCPAMDLQEAAERKHGLSLAVVRDLEDSWRRLF